MKAERFEQILERRKALMTQVLSHKAKEYASDVDRLQNFVDAQALLFPEALDDEGARARCVLAFMAKHVVSVFQMVRSGKSFPRSAWDEKIGDLINYGVLLEAALEDDGLVTHEKTL